jgi:hypothetical protein
VNAIGKIAGMRPIRTARSQEHQQTIPEAKTTIQFGNQKGPTINRPAHPVVSNSPIPPPSVPGIAIVCPPQFRPAAPITPAVARVTTTAVKTREEMRGMKHSDRERTRESGAITCIAWLRPDEDVPGESFEKTTW